MLGFLMAAALAATTPAPAQAASPPASPTTVPANLPPPPVNLLPVGGDEPLRFLERPSASALAQAYPKGPASVGMSGRAVIHCGVGANGWLTRCQATEELPAGLGFGGAAASLGRYFRLDPASEAATQTAIDVPIGFATSALESEVLVAGPWLAAPTFSQVAAVYPDIGGGAAGVVVLHCALDHDGRLRACKTLYAKPTDRNFDAAALKLSRFFRMRIDPGRFKSGQPLATNVTLRLAAPFGDEAKEKKIAAPSWLTGLDPTAVTKMFPSEATAKGLTSGLGYADCVVGADGALADCRPAGGEPADLGFSEAAVKAAGAIRLSPWTDDGGPVDGAPVRVPVRFTRAAK
jgi:hypothetical protein